MYFDSHTHLNSEQLFDSYQEHLAEFESIWWKWLVNIAVDLDRAAKAVKIQKTIILQWDCYQLYDFIQAW